MADFNKIFEYLGSFEKFVVHKSRPVMTTVFDDAPPQECWERCDDLPNDTPGIVWGIYGQDGLEELVADSYNEEISWLICSYLNAIVRTKTPKETVSE